MKFVSSFCKTSFFSIAMSVVLVFSFLGCGSERFENSKKLLGKITPEIPSLSPGDVVDKIANVQTGEADKPIEDVIIETVIITES